MALTKITTSVVAVNSLTAANIADNSIDATKIANNQILARHIASGSLTDQLGTISSLTVGDGHTIGDDSDDNLIIASSAGENIIIDSPDDIILDADGTDIILKDGGTEFGRLMTDSTPNHFYLKSAISNGDMIFQGNDDGSTITALTLDMSAAGKAVFNSNVEVGAAVELTTAGKFIQVAGSSSNYWAIGSSGGENAPGTASTTFAFHRWNGSAWNNAVEIDTDGIIIPDTGTGGIKLGGVASANHLDDYEEGTFTPTFGSATLATDDGSYTKIGNQVTVHFRVITTGGLPTSSSQVQVGNLPFTIGTGFGGVGGLYVGPSNVSSATGGGGTIVPYVTGGETFIRFLNVDTGTYGYTTWGELEVSHNNAVTAIGTVTYTV